MAGKTCLSHPLSRLTPAFSFAGSRDPREDLETHKQISSLLESVLLLLPNPESLWEGMGRGHDSGRPQPDQPHAPISDQLL